MWKNLSYKSLVLACNSCKMYKENLQFWIEILIRIFFLSFHSIAINSMLKIICIILYCRYFNLIFFSYFRALKFPFTYGTTTILNMPRQNTKAEFTKVKIYHLFNLITAVCLLTKTNFCLHFQCYKAVHMVMPVLYYQESGQLIEGGTIVKCFSSIENPMMLWMVLGTLSKFKQSLNLITTQILSYMLATMIQQFWLAR